MKKFFLPLCLVMVIVLIGAYCSMEKQSKPQQVKAYFIKELNAFNQLKDELLKEVERGHDRQKQIEMFRKCRVQYKKLEFFAEYFYPSSAALLNGPPIDEIELGENMVIAPSGLQVIEAFLYSDEQNAESKTKLINQINGLGVTSKRMTALTAQFDVTDAQIFDALRLSLFRITSLGLSAFDTPESLNVCEETKAALSSLSDVLKIYGETPDNLSLVLEQGIKHLEQNTYEKLDILSFTDNYLQPIGKSLIGFRKQLQIPGLNSETPLKADVATLFQKNAFNVNQFIDNHVQFVTPDKVELGKSLFYDVILSDGKNRSCGSCHQPGYMFTDGLTVPSSLSEEKLKRNTPTLMYSGYQTAFFYDLNVPTLEDQALNIVHNKNEMGGSLQKAAEKFNNTGKYREAFRKSFDFDTTKYATPAKIQNALAAYIRSLGKFSSDLDRYMQGDKNALTTQQREGYTLFMGKARCGSCHFAPLFNGTPPPKFDRTEAEVLGVPKHADTIRATIDPDPGRYALNPYPQYKYAFKTPTLRNVEKTSPYMHNGVYRTLDEVMDFYNRGGGSGIGIRLGNQTLSSKPLNLSVGEKKAVISFLNSLTDR